VNAMPSWEQVETAARVLRSVLLGGGGRPKTHSSFKAKVQGRNKLGEE